MTAYPQSSLYLHALETPSENCVQNSFFYFPNVFWQSSLFSSGWVLINSTKPLGQQLLDTVR